ncbi:acyl-protein thioesterase 1 [Aspergillus udagawae]|nr:acyl-protein thioesterase 1 [Aspergillus udagawae]
MVAQLFPPRHVYFPSTPSHTSTVILLHDTNSTGAEVAAALAASTTATATAEKSIFEHFPSCRWVFPSAQPRQIDTCYASRGNWINVDVDIEATTSSDADTNEDADTDANADANVDSPQQRQAQLSSSAEAKDDDENKAEALEACVEYMLQIIEEEVGRLGGDSRRVVLGGFGQGMAVAIATLLAARRRLGGFVGVNGWVPFTEMIEGLGGRGRGWLAEDEARMGGSEGSSGVDGVEVDSEAGKALLETPVLLSYLEDDPYVNTRTGLTAYETLNRLGFVKVVWDPRPGPQQGENWLLDASQLDTLWVSWQRCSVVRNNISAHDVTMLR